MRMPGIRGAGNIGPLVLQQQQMELDRKRQKQEAADAAVRNILAMVNTGFQGVKTGGDLYTGIAGQLADSRLKAAQTADIPLRTGLMGRNVAVDEGRLGIEQGRLQMEKEAHPLEQKQREEAIRRAAAETGKLGVETELMPRDQTFRENLGYGRLNNDFMDANTHRLDVLGRQKLGLFGLQNEDQRLRMMWPLDKEAKESQIRRNNAEAEMDRERLEIERKEMESKYNAPNPAIVNKAVSDMSDKVKPYVDSRITHADAARDAATALSKDPYAVPAETAFVDALLKTLADQGAMGQIEPILKEKYGDEFKEGSKPQAQDWPAIANSPEAFARVLGKLYGETPDDQEEGVTGQLQKLIQQGGGGPKPEFYNQYLEQLAKQQADRAAHFARPENERYDRMGATFGPLFGQWGGGKSAPPPPAPPEDSALIEAAIRRYLQFAR